MTLFHFHSIGIPDPAIPSSCSRLLARSMNIYLLSTRPWAEDFAHDISNTCLQKSQIITIANGWEAELRRVQWFGPTHKHSKGQSQGLPPSMSSCTPLSTAATHELNLKEDWLRSTHPEPPDDCNLRKLSEKVLVGDQLVRPGVWASRIMGGHSLSVLCLLGLSSPTWLPFRLLLAYPKCQPPASLTDGVSFNFFFFFFNVIPPTLYVRCFQDHQSLNCGCLCFGF